MASTLTDSDWATLNKSKFHEMTEAIITIQNISNVPHKEPILWTKLWQQTLIIISLTLVEIMMDKIKQLKNQTACPMNTLIQALAMEKMQITSSHQKINITVKLTVNPKMLTSQHKTYLRMILFLKMFQVFLTSINSDLLPMQIWLKL